MNDERPQAPPGWYTHPAGGRRYWDGATWSDVPPPDDVPPAAVGTGDKESDRTAVGCGIGCLGVLVIAVVIAVFGTLSGSDDEDDGGGEYGARDVCQQFVKDRLKAPGTADFSGESASENSDGSWTVRGDVDSENGFGASLRNSYVCKVRHTSGDNWTLVDMQTTGN